MPKKAKKRTLGDVKIIELVEDVCQKNKFDGFRNCNIDLMLYTRIKLSTQVHRSLLLLLSKIDLFEKYSHNLSQILLNILVC